MQSAFCSVCVGGTDCVYRSRPLVEYRQGRSFNRQIARPRNGNIGRRVRRVARKEFGMNRLLMVAALGALLVGSTGCLHHNLRKPTAGNNACASGNCSSGTCESECGGACATTTLGRMGGLCGVCNGQGSRPGCIPGRLGWQQGGLDYSAHLQPGCMGHHAGDAMNSRPFYPGPATAQVGYPYYSHHGPRDFFVDNPPTLGR